MKLTLGKAGWPVTVTDFDFNTATNDEINILGCLTNYYTLVVVKNQNLKVKTEESICRRIGKTLDETYDQNNITLQDKFRKMFDKNTYDRLVLPGGGDITLRVTGEKNKNGEPGLFPSNEELKWHANKVWSSLRRSMVWLYGERGTAGSITSFTNHIIAYNKMSDEFKTKIKDLKSIFQVEGHFAERSNGVNYNAIETAWPLVYTNVGGQTGIFLSWLHLDHFEGMTPEESETVANTIRDSILLDLECVYDHHWQDGDVLLMEQWLGVHKRPAFEHMDKRVLHRIETDFSKINFTKMSDAVKLAAAQQ